MLIHCCYTDVNEEKDRPSLGMPRHERLVGYTLYYFNYSTWSGLGMYMEDLYVRKEFRSEYITV